jgi:NTP pyrophosphatase (non-canonical NTP hydrolase)
MMSSSATRISAPAAQPASDSPTWIAAKCSVGDFSREPGAHTIAYMQLSEYQRLSRRTAEYPRDAWLTYPSLGLAGEAGEVAEHAKKTIRDDGGTVTDERRLAMAGELGDVLWYVAQLASELGLELEDIARANLEKLSSRQQRGVLSGSGDDR